MGVIDYADTQRMFKCFNHGGNIETEAQFANLLYKQFGEGIYSILGWAKGKSGMWGFLHLELTPSGFLRVMKKKSPEEMRIKMAINEMRGIKNKLSENISNDEKRELQIKMNELKEDIDFEKEIKLFAPNSKYRGPGPYLITSRPVYKFHNYENLNIHKDKEVVESQNFW